MELYSSGASPYARKCRVTLLELGLEAVKVRDVVANPLGGEPALNAANPLGKVPALLLESGDVLFDSRVITRFLNDLAQGNLYPQDALWKNLTLEALADGIMDASVGMVYEDRMRRPHGLVWEDWLEAQWLKVSRALDSLEAQWVSKMADALNAGQIALICALDYLDLRHGARQWQLTCPNLNAWHQQLKTRRNFEATAP